MSDVELEQTVEGNSQLEICPIRCWLSTRNGIRRGLLSLVIRQSPNIWIPDIYVARHVRYFSLAPPRALPSPSWSVDSGKLICRHSVNMLLFPLVSSWSQPGDLATCQQIRGGWDYHIYFPGLTSFGSTITWLCCSIRDGVAVLSGLNNLPLPEVLTPSSGNNYSPLLAWVIMDCLLPPMY